MNTLARNLLAICVLLFSTQLWADKECDRFLDKIAGVQTAEQAIATLGEPTSTEQFDIGTYSWSVDGEQLNVKISNGKLKYITIGSGGCSEKSKVCEAYKNFQKAVGKPISIDNIQDSIGVPPTNVSNGTGNFYIWTVPGYQLKLAVDDEEENVGPFECSQVAE